jgi:hypothetical protein
MRQSQKSVVDRSRVSRAGCLAGQYLCAAEACLIDVYSAISRAKWLLMSYSPIAPAMSLTLSRRRNATKVSYR